MTIDNDILEKLEILSMFKIDKSKKDRTKEELTEIINYINNLNDIKTINVKKIDLSRRLLKDESKNNSDIMKNISNQSSTIVDNFFIVPRVIKN